MTEQVLALHESCRDMLHFLSPLQGKDGDKS